MLKKELLEHLRATHTVRRSGHVSMKRNAFGQIKNAVSISARPPSVEDRAVPGHWEGYLIGGSGNSFPINLASTLPATSPAHSVDRKAYLISTDLLEASAPEERTLFPISFSCSVAASYCIFRKSA